MTTRIAGVELREERDFPEERKQAIELDKCQSMT